MEKGDVLQEKRFLGFGSKLYARQVVFWSCSLAQNIHSVPIFMRRSLPSEELAQVLGKIFLRFAEKIMQFCLRKLLKIDTSLMQRFLK